MFFNPLARNNPNYKVLATAQLTVTDQTDVSNLAGNMTVVNGSRSQTYLTGNSEPFNPNWKKNHLVLRPYMIATSITKQGQDQKYNPDLFDPLEYPNLESPGDIGITSKYIHDIKWYLVDSANNKKEINISSTEFKDKFSHEWDYTRTDGSTIRITDARTLVIKDNILQKDGLASIVVSFAFHDPFADMRIPVTYEIQLSNISTGIGTSKASIDSMDGNSFYNAEDNEELRFEALYFNEGTSVDLNSILQQGSSHGYMVEWYIKTYAGWSLLDPVTQNENSWNSPSEKLYEIHRVVERDDSGRVTKTALTTNPSGGTILKVRPGLIASSEIIKLVVTDGNSSGMKASALENIYDYSDPTQCYIYSSNGDKLYKGVDAPGTNMKAIITYRGQLLEDEDSRYNEMFDYYWYRIDGRGEAIDHIYFEDGLMKYISTSNPQYTPENEYPKASKRDIDIKPVDVDNKATFTVDILNKKELEVAQYRANLLRSIPLEEELNEARIVLERAGIDTQDNEEVVRTAIEMRAFTIAQEDQIVESIAEITRKRGD